jgi:pilus assembly protein Flp/PilA
MLQRLAGLYHNDHGATAVEYGLIAALIAVAIIATVTTLGGRLKNTFGSIANNL